MTSNVFAGLKGIAVLVEEVVEDGAKPGNDTLNREAYAFFGGYAAERLRQAGLPIVPLDSTKDVENAVLYLRPTLIRSPYKATIAAGIEDEVIVFSLALELKQMARLARDTDVTTFATVWESGYTGAFLRGEKGSAVLAQVQALVDHFAQEFKAQQGKEA